MNSQTGEFICATPDNNDPEPEGVYSYSIDPTVFPNSDPIVLNIYFWQVKGPNGEYGGKSFTEETALEAVANLNIIYNKFNIYFKYRGFDSFDTPNVLKRRYEYVPIDENDPNSDYHWTCVNYPGEYDPDGYGIVDRCQIGALWSYALSNGYQIQDALNVYVPYQTDYFGGAAPGYKTTKNIVPVGGLSSLAFPHEIGHNLGLRHTTQSWSNNDNPNDPNSCYSCEHVTRNKFDPNYNANCSGDRIHDTNAVPNFKREHYYELIEAGYSAAYAEANYEPYKYILNCFYEGTGDDCQDELYTINPDDVMNTMLPSHYDLCEDETVFTPGQGIYMRESIDDPTGGLPGVKTNVFELYEPYRGEYYVIGPLPEDYKEPLFQPGFEYRFIECEGDYDEPAPYDEIFTYDINTVLLTVNADETDYGRITHPNHTAIWLKHEIVGNTNVFPQPKKCYNNWNKNPKGGSVTRFIDGVFNTNVTITQQDSTAINNSYLIQSLDNGLYKIEKIYDDGSVQQTVIQKGNN